MFPVRLALVGHDGERVFGEISQRVVGPGMAEDTDNDADEGEDTPRPDPQP